MDDSGLQDLSTLKLPDEAMKRLKSKSRAESVFEHRVQVDPDWWTAALAKSGMPGGPVRGDDAAGTSISRAQLFELAEQARGGDDNDVLRLLWHTLAWGTGRNGRNNQRRIDAVARRGQAQAVRTLRQAGKAARTDPKAAYETLRPGGRNAIAWLGPAFFTKYLYFVGSGDSDHKSLILDARVAASLRGHGWASLGKTAWPPSTYERYCRLVRRWAEEANARVERSCAADELETWLFNRSKA